MAARDRIREVVERWFLVEPLLFAVWTTHHLSIEPRIRSIRVQHGRIEYNPDFLNALDRRQLEAVLRCEALRILLKHPYTRRKEHADLAYAASNVTLQEYLHTSLPLPYAHELFGTHEFDQQYFEFYYYKLQESVDHAAAVALQAGSGAGSAREGRGQAGAALATDLPAETGQAGQAEAADKATPDSLTAYTSAALCGQENTQDWDSDDLLSERLTDVIRTAQETNSWGTVAGRLREHILATLKPKLDYRAVLRQFRASILSVNRVLTRMKPNRRYGFLYMGSRRDFSTRLLVAVDVSGSISSEDLVRGFSVINQFFTYGVNTVDVIQFDTEIKGPMLSLKRARHDIAVAGRGGTSFTPVMAYIDEHRDYDGLIIFTDGYAPVPAKPQNRKTRILWLFNNQSNYERLYPTLRPLGIAAFLHET